VDQRRVALVALETEDGVVLRFDPHDAVPDDLGQHGGGSDGHAPGIAVDDRSDHSLVGLGFQLALAQQVHRPVDQEGVG
jgi:hypothetical protein